MNRQKHITTQKNTLRKSLGYGISSFLGIRNNWGLKTNSKFWMHHKLCRIKAKNIKFSSDALAIATTAHEKGFACLGKAKIQPSTQRAILDYFDNRTARKGKLEMDTNSTQILSDSLFSIVQSISEPIFAYYNSYFQACSVKIQEISPGFQDAGSSFGFHTDDSPYSVNKVFIYFTDTYENNGAFRTFDYATSDKLLQKGMLKSAPPGVARKLTQNLIDKKVLSSLQVLEGPEGTSLLFDNNLIHKGTLPLKGRRIHMVLEIMPSHKEMDLKQFMKNYRTP